MDQERWHTAQTMQQVASSSSSSSRNIMNNTTKTDTKSTSSNMEMDRYKLDMEQAIAMKASLTSNSTKRVIQQQQQSHRDITANDLQLGLKGLDQAQQYKTVQQYKSALKLYELSLELLIQYLKSDSSCTIELPDGTSRGMIEQCVHNALTDAENIKEIIQRHEQQRTSKTDDTDGSVASSVTNAIKATLTRITNNTTTTNNIKSNTTVSTTVKTRNQQQHNNNATIIQNQRINNSSTNPKIRQRPTGTARTNIVSSQTTPTQQRHHTIDLSNELNQTILQEFYMPSENLQRVSWDDIAGLADVKQALQEAAILPILRPDLFVGLRKPRNILLYGPPGTGKTMLVKAVAAESQSSLFIVTSSSLTSKWLGDSEKLVKNLFAIARQMSPSIIFIDEMDALLSSRKGGGGGDGSGGGGSEHEASRRLKTEFMTQIDGIVTTTSPTNGSSSGNNVLLLACTNCPWDIDNAITRRFQRRIYVPLPDMDARKALFHQLVKQIDKHTITPSQITTLAKRTDGFSCSDITALASEAAFGPIRSLSSVQQIKSISYNELRPVTIGDFETALTTITKSITTKQLQNYTSWQKQQQGM